MSTTAQNDVLDESTDAFDDQDFDFAPVGARTVLICEDLSILSDSLRSSIQSAERQVLSATCLADAAEILKREAIDLVLLDLALPDAQGFEGLLKVHEVSPASRIVVMTGSWSTPIIEGAISHGAAGFIRKTGLEFLREVMKAVEGGSPFPREFTSQFGDSRPLETIIAKMETLTRAERRVLAKLMLGMSNRQIAALFKLSEKTVKSHLVRIYRALGAPGRARTVLMVRPVFDQPGFIESYVLKRRVAPNRAHSPRPAALLSVLA